MTQYTLAIQRVLPRGESSRGWGARLLLGDLLVITASVVAAGLVLLVQWGALGSVGEQHTQAVIVGTSVVAGALWFALLGTYESRDSRILGTGGTEYRRVIAATTTAFALFSVVGFLFDLDAARRLLWAFPLGLVLLLVWRNLSRVALIRRRSRGELLVDVMAVGTPDGVGRLRAEFARAAAAGFRVTGEYVTDGSRPTPKAVTALARSALRSGGVLCVLGGSGYHPEDVRELYRALSGSDVTLAVAPSVAGVDPRRLPLHAVSDVALLWVEDPQLSGTARATKRVGDLVVAAVGLVALTLPMLLIAIAVRLDSSGPVLFRQTRAGRGGRPFTMVKYRTMRVGADDERGDLRVEHGGDGATFKLAEDPRVTRVGRVLRRWSLDELPQLGNVLLGSMSLVGPRPHPLDDVARYEDHERRRLRVKPGLTGLWQVEGRSDLPWDESVRLDLHYVENWSLSGDVVLLVRTVGAVVRGRGAY